MAFIAVPNTAQLDMYIYANGQSMENVFHCTQLGTFTETDLQAAVDVLRGWIAGNWVNIVGVDAAVVGIKATSLENDSAPTYEPSLGEPYQGTLTGDLLPMSVAAVASWRTALRGRSFRGRTYHTGMVESQQQAGELTSAALTAVSGAYNALLNAYNESAFQLVVVSRFHNKAPRETGVTTPIQTMHMDGKLRSQRRRNVGIGG